MTSLSHGSFALAPEHSRLAGSIGCVERQERYGAVVGQVDAETTPAPIVRWTASGSAVEVRRQRVAHPS